MPKGLDSFLFVTTGSEAVEAAVKLARRSQTWRCWCPQASLNGSIKSDQIQTILTGRSWKIMEDHGRSWKIMEDHGRWIVRLDFLGLYVCRSSCRSISDSAALKRQNNRSHV